MKKISVLFVLCLLFVAGCSPTGGVQEALEQAAPTLQAAATALAPTVEAAVAETMSTEEVVAGAEAEAGEAAAEHEAACNVADVPLPQSAAVTVRFVNASGHEMRVLWRNPTAEPKEYAVVADGQSFDQETFMGDEWVLEDHDKRTLVYVVTAEPQQCVGLHHWGYEGETGPEHWAELRTEYETCAAGVEQSPIDLTDAGSADLANIVFDYGATPVNILNNGHTIQVDKIENNQIVLAGVTYPLLQFHFHAPSEHTVNGTSYPLEMHLVHHLESGEYAVVGVFIAEGAENSAFAPVWQNLPAEETAAIATGATVDVADLLPANRTYYTYNGSLTTPPCGEGVKWMVMEQPIEMSAEQIAAITDIMPDNNRPTQELNERAPEVDGTP